MPQRHHGLFSNKPNPVSHEDKNLLIRYNNKPDNEDGVKPNNELNQTKPSNGYGGSGSISDYGYEIKIQYNLK